jgi:hypothetical protein
MRALRQIEFGCRSQALLLMTPTVLWLMSCARLAYALSHDKGWIVRTGLLWLVIFVVFPFLSLFLAVVASRNTDLRRFHPRLYYMTIVVASSPVSIPLCVLLVSWLFSLYCSA